MQICRFPISPGQQEELALWLQTSSPLPHFQGLLEHSGSHPSCAFTPALGEQGLGIALWVWLWGVCTCPLAFGRDAKASNLLCLGFETGLLLPALPHFARASPGMLAVQREGGGLWDSPLLARPFLRCVIWAIYLPLRALSLECY